MTHINSETNPPPPIVNDVFKYLRQFLGTNFGIATLPIAVGRIVGRDLIYFCKVDHSRISMDFSRD